MDKNEFKRLERAEEKAYKKRSKQALYDWGIQFENQIIEATEKRYEEKFKQDLKASVDAFIIALMYTLHFSEETQYNAEKCSEVMKDVVATVNMFYEGEYSPEEYKKELAKDEIYLEDIEEEKNEKKENN